MAWVYLTESEDSASHSETGFYRKPIVKSTDTLNASYFLECLRVNFSRLQYGTTSELSRVSSSLRSIWSTQAFPAKTLALQVMAQAWMASAADYFSRSFDLLASWDQSSFSWKMSQLSLLGEVSGSLRSLPAWGMTVGGRLYQPRNLEPYTLENDGFFLPTPTASDYGKNQGRKTKSNPHPRERWSLTVRASRGELRGHPKGLLHPEWVELAMGYPVGATAIKPWAMQWFRSKQGRRSCA